MKLYAVAGRPVFHSLSPALHNFLAARHGIEASYCRLRVDTAAEIDLFLRERIFCGINVTAPWKEEARKLADLCEKEAGLLNAANTLLAENSRLVAANTDPAGVEQCLKSADIELGGRPCLVLGAGGAGRAAVLALKQAGGLVTLINRSAKRGRETARTLNCRVRAWAELPAALAENTLLINTTPICPPELTRHDLNPDTVVFDADYRLRPMARIASEKNCRYLGGENWLLHQGLAAFARFHGLEKIDKRNLAGLELKAPENKQIISLIGFMGCGKSTLAPLLAEKLGYSWVDADKYLETTTGLSINSVFDRWGEQGFRHLEKKIAGDLLRRERTVIAWGGGVILDPDCRSMLRHDSHVIWLYLPLARLKPRLAGSRRPLLAAAAERPSIEELFNRRTCLYGQSADLVLLNDKKPEEVADVLAAEISPFVKN